MEAILTTPTSPRATWTQNIAPPNSPMLPLPPRQSPPRAKGKERPRARIQLHLLKSQRPVLRPPSLRGHYHCLQQSVASLPSASSPSNMRTQSAWPLLPQTSWPRSFRTPTAPIPFPSPPLLTPKELSPCSALTSIPPPLLTPHIIRQWLTSLIRPSP